tara:strand:- start:240 stop:596 length:357 start_codon:yes stop_codon:yes gene_type:complete
MKLPGNWQGYLYLSFATLGAILPILANIQFMKEYGPAFDIETFIRLSNINPAAQSLSRDLFIGAGAVMFWMINESRRLKIRRFWFVILTTFTISFAFATPFFLFMREQRLLEIKDSKA